jgi:hypothetical protein
VIGKSQHYQFGRNTATYLEANPIKQIFIVSDIREILRDFAARGQEHPIGHFPEYIRISESAIDDVTPMLCTNIMFALWTAVTRFRPFA